MSLFGFSTAPGYSRRLCKKRIVTCVLLDVEGRVLSVGVNQCFGDAETGECLRLAKRNTRDNYHMANDCRSIHAGVDAISRYEYMKHRVEMVNGRARAPHRAVISGHDFVCSACEALLREHGVVVIEVHESNGGRHGWAS